MLNRRLSQILERYRWRARSPIYRPRIIIALIWTCIILSLVFHVAL